MLGFAAPTCAPRSASTSPVGLITGITRVGDGLVRVLFFADRVGRRSVMMLTVIGFTVANGATALVTDKVQFTVLQLVARLFLTASTRSRSS
jgi:MFS family permease